MWTDPATITGLVLAVTGLVAGATALAKVITHQQDHPQAEAPAVPPVVSMAPPAPSAPFRSGDAASGEAPARPDGAPAAGPAPVKPAGQPKGM